MIRFIGGIRVFSRTHHRLDLCLNQRFESRQVDRKCSDPLLSKYVANFGAVVDLGVKRDGLIHVSQLADRWIDNPRDVVEVGEVVKVRVLEVDRERGRISLSRRT